MKAVDPSPQKKTHLLTGSFVDYFKDFRLLEAWLVMKPGWTQLLLVQAWLSKRPTIISAYSN